MPNNRAGQRKRVPKRVRTAVIFKSDRKCCVCEGRETGTQLHHLDGDPSNNKDGNLVLLCHKHHEDAERRGGTTIRLDAATIEEYRRHWYMTVERRRRTQLATATLSPASRARFDEVMEAVQTADVRRTWNLCSQRDWDSVRTALATISTYAPQSGYRLRLEVLEVCYDLSGSVRMDMPLDVARTVASVTRSAAVQRGTPQATGRRLSSADKEILVFSAEIGFSIVHDGAKYLHDLRVVGAGAEVLWLALRFAHRCKAPGLEKRITEIFDRALDSARRGRGESFEDAIRWLEFEKADALCLEDDPLPQMPHDLAKIVHGDH